MDVQAAINRLRGGLCEELENRFRFSCRKAVLFIRLQNRRTSDRFAVPDNVPFRLDDQNLIVEDFRTRALGFPLDRIESVVAGEPESDDTDLFQG
jgi:hypothetical protein